MKENAERGAHMMKKRMILAAAALLMLAGCSALPGLAGSGSSAGSGDAPPAQTAAPQTAETAQRVQHPGETPVLSRQHISGTDGAAYQTVHYRYDAKGRLIEEASRSSYGYGSRIRYEYDDAGNRVRETQLDLYGVIVWWQEENQYDEAGRLLCQTYGSGSEDRYEYNDAGDLVRKESWAEGRCWRTETYQYSDAGEGNRWVDIYTGEGTRDRRELWDGQGRILSCQYGNSSPTLTEYDEYGNITREGSTRYEYTYENGRVTTKTWLDSEDGRMYQRADYVYAMLDDAMAEIDFGGRPVPEGEDLNGIQKPQYLIPRGARQHYYTTAKDNLVLRSGPGTEYERLDSIPYQTEIEQAGYTDGLTGWFVTQYNGLWGWVSSEYVEQGGGMEKPVLYLYPQRPTEVEVRLTLPGGRLTCTYPDYRDGWHVLAQPDGTLTDLADGLEYSYLYWEGTGPARWDFSHGFVVPGEQTAQFLRQALAEMGLTPQEYNEFIVYWLPRMQNNRYNLIAFQTEAYTQSALLEIDPAPDSLLRVFMAYQPLEEPVEVPPQTFAPFAREGFTAVEWGGACVE